MVHKFRVWNAVEKKMYMPPGAGTYQPYWVIDQNGFLELLDHKPLSDLYISLSWEACTDMLFSGILDIYKKEIYEGDYVGYNNHMSNHYHQDEVKFENGRFTPLTDENESGAPEWINFRIIGNKWETPDLLST